MNLARAKMSLDSREDLSSMLTDVEDSCRRAKDLTNKLITFSKGGTPVKKIMSIKEQLKDAAMFALRGSHIECKFHLPNDLWQVEIDEGQINQVVINLVINATQAMANGGTIHITAENLYAGAQNIFSLPDSDFIKITVRDEGHGIHKEHIQKIFDPYFTTKKKGSGLGLSSAYSIIKNHNGYIDVQSEPESGTVFYIYLPASKIKPIVKDKETKPLEGEGYVLLMDDDDTLRTTIRKTLNQIGYEIQLSSDGSEAVELYSKALSSDKPFDVVIMDLTISNGMGGKEAIAKLLEIDPKVKAIVSSGYSDDTIMANYRNYGFCGIITKPYEISDLNELLCAVIKDDHKSS
jgi:CheY-like chemotaxis protein